MKQIGPTLPHFRRIYLLSSLLGSCLSLWAGVWSTSGFDGFASPKNEVENVSIDPEGNVTLAPRLRELFSLRDAVLWSLVAATNHRLYAATGPDGRVYVWNKKDGLRTVFESEALQVLCLAADKKGNIYFATSPGGDIYRLASGSSAPRKMCSTGTEYVFALLPGTKGELYCATGQQGKLYRVSPAGQIQELFGAIQPHLTCLAWLVEGKELLVGTSPDGVVYRLSLSPTSSAISSVSVLYDASQEEIRALVAHNPQNGISQPLVFLATNPGENRTGQNPAVLCCDTAGIVRWQWDSPESTIFDILTYSPASAPRGTERFPSLLVSTGNNGLLFLLDSLGRAKLLQKAEDLRLVKLTRGTDRIWIGSTSTTKIYSLEPELAANGSITAEPFDCAGPAQFGRLAFRGEVPNGSNLTFETRSGNSAQPDSTWSNWQPANGNIRSPRGRFLQWRAQLTSTFPRITPRLEQVDIHYRIPNRPPILKKLEVSGVSLDDARQGKSSPIRNITWEAQDPDSDSLSCELQYLGADLPPTRWRTLISNISGSSQELDTRTLPDGWGRFKLIVSDHPSAPAGEAIRTETVSRPVLIDNTPPRVIDLNLGKNSLTFTVRDETSPLVACRYSINSESWKTLLPTDGIFDSPTESFRITLPALTAPFIVSVWAADAAGNTTVSAVSAP